MNPRLYKRMDTLMICQDQESVCPVDARPACRQKETGMRWENLAGNAVYRRLFTPTLARFALLNFKYRAFQIRSGFEHGFRSLSSPPFARAALEAVNKKRLTIMEISMFDFMIDLSYG
jgi:hypothetical protein